MRPTELIAEYADGARLLRESVDGMTAEQLDARPIAGKMTTRELICHLADFELVGTERLKRILFEERPLLPGFDQDVMARSLGYDVRDPAEELALIELVRRHTTRILHSVPDSAWSRVGVHSEAGELTLERLLHRVTKHLTHHLPFIAEKRRAIGV
jgi:DinB superfamily